MADGPNITGLPLAADTARTVAPTPERAVSAPTAPRATGDSVALSQGAALLLDETDGPAPSTDPVEAAALSGVVAYADGARESVDPVETAAVAQIAQPAAETGAADAADLLRAQTAFQRVETATNTPAPAEEISVGGAVSATAKRTLDLYS